MATSNMRKPNKQEGITLLVTLLLMGVLLGIGASLLNVTLKQFQLSGIALSSEVAFQAANAGMECALYWDFPMSGPSPFDIPSPGGTTEQATRPEISCMGSGLVSADNTLDDNTDGKMKSGEEQLFQFDWGSPAVCSDVSVYKFYDESIPVQVTVNGKEMRDAGGGPANECPTGSVCTVIQSRGYNVGCGDIGTASRVVEREYTLVY